jgi:hypothetical protein
MLTQTVTVPLSESQRELNEDLRHYAATYVTQVCPLRPVVVSAIEDNFPGLLAQSDSIDDTLEKLGIVVIEDIGQGFDPKRISWSITDIREEAEAQLGQYMEPSYRKLRKALSIDYHWIFFVPDRDLYLYTDEELTEGFGSFRSAGKPESWILDSFR